MSTGRVKDGHSLGGVVERMRRPLEQERRMGAGNAAVFGGVDAFVARCLEQARALPEAERLAGTLNELGAVFADYAALSPAQRVKRLERAGQLLDVLEGSAPAGFARAAGGGSEPGAPAGFARAAGGGSEPGASPGFARAAGGGSEPGIPGAPRRGGADGFKADTPVRRLPRVGPSVVTRLERLGLRCIEDLLWHLPRRHEDRSRLRRLDELVAGEVATVAGTVRGVSEMNTRTGVTITRAVLTDGSGPRLTLVWFNRRYLKKQLKSGMRLLACGKVECWGQKWQMKSPDFEDLGEDEGLHVGRIVPVYGLTEGLQQRAMRRIVAEAVLNHAEVLEEFLPPSVVAAQGLMPRSEAMRAVHFPPDFGTRDAALERLVFEELFVLQIGLALRRRETERLPRSLRYDLSDDPAGAFEESLAFRLTGAQRRVLGELQGDLERTAPMSRLIQGDVGSGKTVVAAFAAWLACRSGHQAAIMAPTEILAEQLSRKIQELIGGQFSVRLLKGAMSAREKARATDALALGEADVAVGTHALIQDDVRFRSLAMVVIDEQHKFGVAQRSQLRNKGYNPDVLVMTATPIPRTLALTVYGDLDVSIIDELPPGRTPIKSLWKPSEQAPKIYEGLRRQVAKGRQAYIVCPLIEESESVEAAAATAVHEQLCRDVFPDLRLGLLHGRMRSEEKEQVMESFRQGEFDVLVSTTVIEVGVDVPNATLMIIQDSERFGLAQLHQLRGRVGRGAHESFCVFLADPETEEGRQRMDVIASTTDGFRIAEEDMRLRGPGDFYGSRQSGLPDLRVADLVKDFAVLQRAKGAAWEVVARDPAISGPDCVPLRAQVLRTFGSHVAKLLS